MRVLLVDDNAAFLKAASELLCAEPRINVVGCVRSVAEALREIPKTHPDVVLLDLAMPDMDGLSATKHIKAIPGAPRVVIVSLHDLPACRATAQSLGADAFINKADLYEQLPLVLHGMFAVIQISERWQELTHSPGSSIESSQ